jgi:hypothetical protein
MRDDKSLAVTLRIEQIIATVRGQRVILDSDLAAIYGVTTKVLNQAVRRNIERFPSDFVFRLTLQEVTKLRSQFVTSSGDGEWPRIPTASDSEENRSQFVTGSQKHRDPRFRPYAFSEHGALMAANVLRSPRAVEMSVFVVRAFVRLRQWLAGHAELSHRLDELERKYDSQFRVIFEAIRQLMTPPGRKRKEIGFHVREPRPVYRTHRKAR